MRSLTAVIVLALVMSAGTACQNENHPRAAASPTTTATATGPADDPRGDPHVLPAAYRWLSDIRPEITYHLIVVRGLGPRAVLRQLRPVRERLGLLRPPRASAYVNRHTDRHYRSPTVVQIDRRGRSTVVYVPDGFLLDEAVRRLSRRGAAVAFTNTVEWDTYLSIFRRGREVQTFDAGFRPPRAELVAQKRGLDWGKRRQNIWATAWTFIERVTRTHISKMWFYSPHPTYVVKHDFPGQY